MFDKKASDTHMYNIFAFVCDGSAGGNNAFKVTVTDTKANWANTVDHCANVLVGDPVEEGSGPDATEKRTYLVEGPTGVNTVTFYRQ